jgi:hypothetical protein
MSYLGCPRFSFAGTFFADPSTVNNDPAHYEDETFDRTTAWDPALDGWWNPDGRHSFRFEDVTVRSAVAGDGAAVAGDPVLGLRFVSRGPTPAKLVDLDTDAPAQLVSMIYGLQVALVDAGGTVLVEAAMEPVPFTDIWRRGSTGSGDEAACAAYQSTLAVLRWGELPPSGFLRELHDAADGLLSIKFDVDGYSMRSTVGGAPNPRFARGRIVGTVGIAAAGEPAHTVVGRQFGSEEHEPLSASPGFRPTGGVNYFPGLVDPAARKVRLDLGNALPAATAGGPVQDIGELVLACRADDGSVTDIAPIDYRGAGWYETTAGVVDLPADRQLSDVEAERVAAGRLLLLARRNGQQRILIEEAPVSVRADAFVTRLDPGGRWVARLHVAERGRPLAGARVNVFLVPPPGPAEAAAIPVGGLTFPGVVTTDAQGIAEVPLEAADPGALRVYYGGGRRERADGQLYVVGYAVEGVAQPNPSNLLRVLVWNTFVPDDPPTWHGSIRDVLTQYGDLYPWMTRFGPRLDLAEHKQIADQREAVLAVLDRPITDPRYMPVSRDMSGSRRAAIVTWLTNVDADGRPLLGTEPPPHAVEEAAPARRAARRAGPEAELGGKTAAALRLQRTPG